MIGFSQHEIVFDDRQHAACKNVTDVWRIVALCLLPGLLKKKLVGGGWVGMLRHAQMIL